MMRNDEPRAQVLQPGDDGELCRVGTEAALIDLTLVDFAQSPRARITHPGINPSRAQAGF